VWDLSFVVANIDALIFRDSAETDDGTGFEAAGEDAGDVISSSDGKHSVFLSHLLAGSERVLKRGTG
jgi:hypothetical protein